MFRYFGFPATAILLGEGRIRTAIFIIIGYNLYEYSPEPFSRASNLVCKSR